MEEKLDIAKSADIHQTLVNKYGFVLENYGRESTCKVSKDYGQGYFRRIYLREGLEIRLTDLLLTKKLRLNYKKNRFPMEVCYYLSGYITQHEKSFSENIFCNQGQMQISLQENREGWLDYPVGVKCEIISVCATSSFLKSFSVKDVFKNINCEKNHDLSHPQKINPALIIPFNQIKKCSFLGLSRLMYLESRALEILSLTSEMEILTNKCNNKYLKIRESDKQRIREVKELMAENMINPLTINQLGRKVGINTFKLKTGFKQLYGTTIFGYLRDLRLEKARTLLEDREMNISQIANEVGYANPSHFTAAFKKKFGCNPSALRCFNNFR